MKRAITSTDIFRYYVNYKDTEESIIQAIYGRELKPRQEALKKYINNYMRIGRNFRAGTYDMDFGWVKLNCRSQ